MKTPTPFSRPKILARLTAAIFSLYAVSAGATTFEQSPMLGIGSSYPPNVLLALSVEFPTAGAAYQKKDTSTTNPDKYLELTEEEFKKTTYLGYFDPNKCYIYNTNGGYFEPIKAAPADRFCGSHNNTFSGNVLNWITMTTIDIFRQAMTGGNRANGLDTEPTNYDNGDLEGRTILRRAYVNYTQNAAYGLYVKAIAPGLARKVLPAHIVDKVPQTNGAKLLIRNEGFQMAFGYVENATARSHNYYFPNDNPKKTNTTYYYYNRSLPSPINNKDAYNVQVEVCKPDMPENNCRAYSATNLKPEGLMQEYRQKMRFSVFGYLNSNSVYPKGKQINGGVMRARMKSLAGETTADGIVLGNEINTQIGQFETNPDQ